MFTGNALNGSINKVSLAVLTALLLILMLPRIAADDSECVFVIDSTRSDDRSSYTDPSERTFDIQFMIEPSLDPLDPFYNQKWARVIPGSESIYRVLIQNIGSFNDSYTLQLEDPPEDQGWDWFFQSNGERYLDVDLTSPHLRDLYGGISFRSYPIRVLCPIDGSDGRDIEMKVKATSHFAEGEGLENITTDVDSIHLVPGSACSVRIPPNHKRFFHSERIEFFSMFVNITNLGNKDPIDVIVTIEEDDRWRTSYRDFEEHYIPKTHCLEFNWTEREVQVKQGGTVQLELSFRPPSEWAGEGDIFQFKYMGWIKDTNWWFHSDIITVFVGDPFRYYHIEPDNTTESNSTTTNPPIPIISSPSEYLVYGGSNTLILDGSRSLELDNDTISYKWHSDRDGDLGTGAVLQRKLSVGEHEISLTVSDGEFNVTETILVHIIQEVVEIDTDNDGIPDEKDPDDDNDGLLDSEEDINGNGLTEEGETDPLMMDTDQDGFSDLVDDEPLDPYAPTMEETTEIRNVVLPAIIAILFIMILIPAIAVAVVVILIKRSAME